MTSINTTNRIVKNTGILYAKMGITLVISLFTTRLVLSSLGVQDFGIFNVVGGAIAMMTFLNSAMAGATQRFMSFAEGSGNKEKLKSIFNVSIILHLLIALIIGIILEIAAYFLFHGVLNIPSNRIHAAHVIYQFMIVSTMFTIMTVPYDAVVNSHENMLYYAIVGIVESLLKLTVAIVIIYIFSDKLIIYGLLMAIVSLIIMIIMRLYCHKRYIECVIAPREYFDKAIMKEMTNFAGWNFLSSASGMLGAYGLLIVLNHFFGTIVNAAQGVAGQLNGQLIVFSSTMMKALNPVIVKSEGGGKRDAMLNMSLMGCKFSFLLFIFFAIPFLLETQFILKLWLKNVPEWSVIFCKLAITQTLLEQLTLALGTTIGAQGDIKRFSGIKSILNVLLLPLTYVIFKLGGPPYMMYVILIFLWGIIGGILTVYFTIKNCNLKIKDYLQQVLYKSLTVFIVTFGLASIPTFIMNDSFQRALFVVIISTTTFIIILFTYGLTKVEKLFIADSFNLLKERYSIIKH